MQKNFSAISLSISLDEEFQPTEQQQKVIEAPLAPALVVAGAGSGKTTTMADRVAYMIATNQVKPDEVLGLTFTRKATQELSAKIRRKIKLLRERGLLKLDAAEQFLEPTISTYNSFANSIFRDNALLVGREPDSLLLDESAAWSLMHKIAIENGELALAAFDYSVSTVVSAAYELSQAITSNLVDLDELAAFPSKFDYLQDLPLSLTNKRLRKTPDPVLKAQLSLGALPELVKLVRLFQAEKKRRNLVEYSDQIALALDVIQIAPEVAESIRGRYKLIILDEYQDTSSVDSKLLSKLFAGAGVMAVGDPHQSIYGWRGASASNLGRFAADYRSKPEDLYSLNISWRNDENILKAANLIAKPLQESSQVPVTELAARPKAGPGEITGHFWQTDREETTAVADWLAKILSSYSSDNATKTSDDKRTSPTTNSGDKTPKPAKTKPNPPELAILFRTKSSMPAFAAALAEKNIPYEIVGLGGLLTTPEVTDVVCTLKVLSDPQAGNELIRLLSGGRWRLGVSDLAALQQLSSWLNKRDISQQALSMRVTEQLQSYVAQEAQSSIVDALDFIDTAPSAHTALKNFTEAGLARLREAAATLYKLRKLAAVVTLPQLINLVIAELNLDLELAANEHSLGTANLSAFENQVHNFLNTSNNADLSTLLGWLDRVANNDNLQPATEPARPGVVQLLTIHAAKGLEWDYVAVPRLLQGSFPNTGKDVYGWLGFGKLPYPFHDDAADLPELVLSGHSALDEVAEEILEFKEKLAEHSLAEERRLGYVAITRAKHGLMLSGSYWQENRANPAKVSDFYTELVKDFLDKADEASSTENPNLELEQSLTWPNDPLGKRRGLVTESAALVEQAINAAAEPAEHSLATLIDALLAERAENTAKLNIALPTRIPASKYKDFLLRESEQLAELARPMPKQPFKQTRLGTQFHTMIELSATRHGLQELFDARDYELDKTQADYADKAALAELKATFDNSEWGGLMPHSVELEIHLPLAGHLVICKIDAVYKHGERYEVVDWKTGKVPSTESEKSERLLQIQLYRLAFSELESIPLDQIDAALYYVAADTVIRPDETLTRADLEDQWFQNHSRPVTE